MAFENQKIDKLSASITELLSAQNVDVDSVILFGSYANGKQTKDSDLD
ncbi:MAG: nucleotidyltransferase domain-containing protein, partial [Bacteroidetes bacterium]|nr:nucleotidyltransferase domain-containing protein [Bacteroidota bacterium]